MTPELRDAVFALPEEGKRQLVDELVAELEHGNDDDLTDEEYEELDRREAHLKSNPESARPWSEVYAKLRARYGGDPDSQGQRLGFEVDVSDDSQDGNNETPSEEVTVMAPELRAAVFALPADERRKLAEELVASIEQEDDLPPVPQWQIDELERRRVKFEANPESGLTWEQVVASIQDRDGR